MDEVLAITKALIKKASVTPHDAGCQELIADYLKPLGFEIKRINVGKVSNLWARIGSSKPLTVFAGHTDVVPPGVGWKTDPFNPLEREGRLYGRGVADMKGALAAMLVAARSFLKEAQTFSGSLGFLITSDEEGDALDGTAKVVEYLKQNNIFIDYCIIGEPTSERILGDTIKVGRRGSLNGELTVLGKQGHIAYPSLSDNPIPKVLAILNELYHYQWDRGGLNLPATQFEVSNIQAGLGVDNVVPGEAQVRFNFRFSDQVTTSDLKTKLETIINHHTSDYHLNWKKASDAFYNKNKILFEKTKEVVKYELGVLANASATGGVSDGRFIMEIAGEVVELGLSRESIHQANEQVKVETLQLLAKVYKALLRKCFELDG